MNAAGVSWWVRLWTFLKRRFEFHFPEGSDTSIPWDDGELQQENDNVERMSADARQLANIRLQNR